MKRLGIVVAAATIAASAIPGHAFHNPSVPLIDQFRGPGTHWVAWRFSVPHEATISYEVEIDGTEERRQGAFIEMLRGDTGYFFTILGVANELNHGTHVQTVATGTLIEEPGELEVVEFGAAAVLRVPAGEYTLVQAWDAVDSGIARLYGESGVTLRGRTDGADAAWSPQRRFDGVLNADQNGTGATVAGNVRTEVIGRLFGVFTMFPATGVEVLSFLGPAGHGVRVDDVVFVDDRSPDVFVLDSPGFGFFDAPPGTYDFSVLGRAHLDGGVTLFTADVHLP